MLSVDSHGRNVQSQQPRSSPTPNSLQIFLKQKLSVFLPSRHHLPLAAPKPKTQCVLPCRCCEDHTTRRTTGDSNHTKWPWDRSRHSYRKLSRIACDQACLTKKLPGTFGHLQLLTMRWQICINVEQIRCRQNGSILPTNTYKTLRSRLAKHWQSHQHAAATAKVFGQWIRNAFRQRVGLRTEKNRMKVAESRHRHHGNRIHDTHGWLVHIVICMVLVDSPLPGILQLKKRFTYVSQLGPLPACDPRRQGGLARRWRPLKPAQTGKRYPRLFVRGSTNLQ